jgi:hypothetical protein
MAFDGAPVGMAHFIAPASSASEEGAVPSVFVCNVGLLERGYDAVIVGDATAKMSGTLPQAEGFAGQRETASRWKAKNGGGMMTASGRVAAVLRDWRLGCRWIPLE